MKFLAWRDNRWLQVAIVVLTVVVTIALASHPELRLLIPFVDSLGLDLAALLIGSQLLEFLMPFALSIHRRVLEPAALVFYQFAIFMLGIVGPQVDGYVSSRRYSAASVASGRVTWNAAPPPSRCSHHS